MSLGGGTNNVLDGLDPTLAFDNMTALVEESKGSTSNIVVLTSPNCPGFSGAQITRNDTYNGLLIDEYGNGQDGKVKLIDLSMVLIDADFADDTIHILIQGHEKIEGQRSGLQLS